MNIAPIIAQVIPRRYRVFRGHVAGQAGPVLQPQSVPLSRLSPPAISASTPRSLGKNWLFIGDAEAGQRSAIIYTVNASCRRRGLDPDAYLREVLTRLPQMTNRQIPEVLPAVWGKPQRTLQVQTAS